MINKQFLKIACITSFLTGAFLGLIPLIPIFTGIAFIFLMFFISPFILIYYKKLNLIKEFEIEKVLTIGALSGFCATIGFAAVYFPIAFLAQMIFKIQSFIWIKVIFTNIGFLIPMVFFTAIVGAVLNMFSAFLVAYYFLYIRQNKQ